MNLTWNVIYLEEAEQELRFLPDEEVGAILHVAEKLGARGILLGFPHSSAVRGFAGLRELRPRAGRSPWRAFYGRSGDAFTIAAIGPEAEQDRRGFERAARNAVVRLKKQRKGA